MEVRIELEDAALCGGCPFESGEKQCKAGFVRENARVVEKRVRTYHIFGEYQESEHLGFKLVRPLSCVVATERAASAVGKVPVQGGIDLAAGGVNPRVKVKKVFVCSRCGIEHKNYEPCRGQR